MLWLCYFPVGVGWLAWVALVPLIGLVRMQLSARQRLLAAWVAGLVFFFPAIQWMRVADWRMYFTWISLALYCSLFVPLGVALVRRLDRRTRLPLVLTLPAVWTALEYVRAHALTGFPWYFLGHSQHDYLALIQVSDLAGAYAVTFLVAAGNAVAFEWLCLLPGFRRLLGLPDPPSGSRLRWRVAQTVALLNGVMAVIGYGRWRLGQDDFEAGPRVALLQGNLDQRIKDEALAREGDAQTIVFNHYVALCDQAARQPHRPALIVWPETSWPGTWLEQPPGQPHEECRRMMQYFAQHWATDSLVGLNTVVTDEGGRPRRYNSALLLGADGKPAARYDKIHRVPFGEYVPLLDWFPWMQYFAPYDFPYSVLPGDGQTRLPLGPYRFGVLICYEDTDPYLARQYVRRDGAEPAADFLVNISNDGWFNGTSEHEEHLAICRFRAVECRRAVARAVNMGVSAVIDGNGRVLAPRPATPTEGVTPAVWELDVPGGPAESLATSDWARFKKVSGMLTGTIPLDRRQSLYAAWGDWLPQACGLVAALGLLTSAFFRRRGAQVARA
jgi:apolipoprotein N-acyltransferase